MKKGIRFKIICFISLLLAIVIFILSFFVLKGIKNNQKTELEEILIAEKDRIEEYLDEQFCESTGKDKEKEKVILANFNSLIYEKFYLQSMPIQIYDLKGKPYNNIYKKDYNNNNIDEFFNYLKDNKMIYKNKGNRIYFYSPLKHNKETVAFIEIDYNNTKRIDFYNKTKNLFIIIGIISMCIGIVFAIIYFLQFTRSILKLNEYVGYVENGEFKKVGYIKRKDELGDLSKGIVYMSNSIEKNINELNTERKYLNLAVDKLKKITKEQKDFIGNVTHEFKTPISVINVYADLLKLYGEDINLVNEAGENISYQSNRLKEMVDSILNLSSLEKYDFELNFKNINLKKIIEDIVTAMKLKAEKNFISIILNMEDVFICADEESMRHIFINLLDNAIKYNTEGGKVIFASRGYDNYYIVQVIDNGIGITKDDSGKIFEPFYRVDKERTSSINGSGIGLTLVKKLVEKHKGEVWAESNSENGTTICIKFNKAKI